MWRPECGTVKFFDERAGKKFGFIRVLDDNDKETGEEIFFHFNDGELISTVLQGEIDFRGSVAVLAGHRTEVSTPHKGDKIYFFRKPGKDGKPKACPWGAANQRYLWGPDHPTISEVLEKEEADARDQSIENDLLEEDGEELVSMSTVRQRASQHFGGNTELAREAAEMYPGDFIT